MFYLEDFKVNFCRIGQWILSAESYYFLR